MKKNALKLGLFSMVLLGMVSCKNEEKDLADKRISELEHYVDSLKAVSVADLETNWNKISVDFDKRNMEANEALVKLDENTQNSYKVKTDAANAKYDELKTSVETKAAEVKVTVMPNSKQKLRNTLFGEGKLGDDMSFAWVNANNILSVYDTFFQSYKDNKGNFSREDYDEIKLIYEALDTRKNTVEKEGLSSSDNGKIASIKFKFGPMLKVNRIGAKSDENQEAKE